jgi:hypothetical protein
MRVLIAPMLLLKVRMIGLEKITDFLIIKLCVITYSFMLSNVLLGGHGGHWYNSEILEVDPWLPIGYLSTDEDGCAHYANCVLMGFDVSLQPELLEGRAFVIHANDGSRVSCGIIECASTNFEPAVLTTTTTPIPGASGEVLGSVDVMTEVQANVVEGVCYQGYAPGLEPNVESFLLGTGSEQCNVANGCGSHIHAGYGCSTTEEQLGHLYDPDTVPVDP